MTGRERIGAVFVYLVLGIAIVVSLFPFWWMLVTSLKRPVDIFSGVALWPQQLTFSNYYRLIAEFHFGSYLLNSILIVVASVFIALVIGTLAAYSLARFRMQFGVRKMARRELPSTIAASSISRGISSRKLCIIQTTKLVLSPE